MAAVTLWLWDNTNKRWVKAQCDPAGKLTISDLTFPTEYPLPAAQVTDLKAITSYPDPVISQTTPQSLKHVPHGYYAVGNAYLPLAVDADGVLLTTEKVKALTITFIIDGGGSAITTGQKGHLEIPFACTLTGWTLVADVAGAIVIDVWKDTYANFPPTNIDAMPGGGKEPTIAATNQMAQDTDISDWASVAVAAGNILAFNVDSCTTITRVTLSLKATKT